jgi:hypothetical protein
LRNNYSSRNRCALASATVLLLGGCAQLQSTTDEGHRREKVGWDASALSKDSKKQDTRLKLVGPEAADAKIKVNIRHGTVRQACNKTGDSALCRGAAADAGIDIASGQYVRILPSYLQSATRPMTSVTHDDTQLAPACAATTVTTKKPTA